MHFYVYPAPDDVTYPYVLLKRSVWDDFLFKTTFTAYLVRAEEVQKTNLGNVKIGAVGQSSGKTDIPMDFPALGPDCFSLGQSDYYYDRVSETGFGEEILRALQDVTENPAQLEKAKNEKVFNFSLTRSLASLTRLNLDPDNTDDSNDVILDCSFIINNSPVKTECKFKFTSADSGLGRINVLVGKNGAGKTQFLANLVNAATGNGELEEILPGRERVSKVIAVSYSIFDRFFLPSDIILPGTGRRKEVYDSFKYVYIGMREKATETGSLSIAGPTTLARRFTKDLKKISASGGRSNWERIMDPIFLDAEFRPNVNAGDSAMQAGFKKFGAGHKSTLSILTSLYAVMSENSLVVIDEPENHLHPTLLSSTMHVLRQMLIEFKSNAIISTHSPIVVQEIPSKNVHVMRKIDGHSRIDTLRRESFGTSIDTLTSELFEISSATPNYLTVLENWARDGKTLEEIDNCLGLPLSAEARSYYRSMEVGN